jgi:hypothetical protein
MNRAMPCLVPRVVFSLAAGLAIVHGLELLVADLHQHEWLVATGLLAAVSLVLLVIHGRDWKTFVIVERLLGEVIRRKD